MLSDELLRFTYQLIFAIINESEIKIYWASFSYDLRLYFSLITLINLARSLSGRGGDSNYSWKAIVVGRIL